MNNQAIMELYWARDQLAIRKSDEKYGLYCRTIAHNVLQDPESGSQPLGEAACPKAGRWAAASGAGGTVGMHSGRRLSRAGDGGMGVDRPVGGLSGYPAPVGAGDFSPPLLVSHAGKGHRQKSLGQREQGENVPLRSRNKLRELLEKAGICL